VYRARVARGAELKGMNVDFTETVLAKTFANSLGLVV
jgi:hypothetical protein